MKWPFRRSAPPRAVPLDNDSLDRAIRAGVHFELKWFLLQPPEIQEAIAARRDLWLEDLVVAAGYAVLDPERTRLGMAAEDGDEEAEAQLTELNAHALAEVMARHAASEGAGEPQPAKRQTMSGMGERRREAAAEREAGRRKPSFFGAEEVKA